MCYKDPVITDEDLRWNGKADGDSEDAAEVSLYGLRCAVSGMSKLGL